MADELPADNPESPRAKAAAAVRVDPQTAQAWALVSIADSLASLARDVHRMAKTRG